MLHRCSKLLLVQSFRKIAITTETDNWTDMLNIGTYAEKPICRLYYIAEVDAKIKHFGKHDNGGW